MTSEYYLGRRPFGRKGHMLHKHGCPFTEGNQKLIPVGKHSSSESALLESERLSTVVVPCLFCSADIVKKVPEIINLPLSNDFRQVYESVNASGPLAMLTGCVN